MSASPSERATDGGDTADGTPTVLMVGRNRRDTGLVTDLLESEGLNTETVTELESLDRLLGQADDRELNGSDSELSLHTVPVAIVDADGFAVTLWEHCERLRNAGPALVVLSLEATAVRRRAPVDLRGTVYDKPIDPRRLVDLVQDDI